MKLAQDFLAVPNGEIYPRTFKAGEECPVELEDVAKDLGLFDAPKKGKARPATPEAGESGEGAQA